MPSLTSIVIGLAALSATAFASLTGVEQVDTGLERRAPSWRPHRPHPRPQTCTYDHNCKPSKVPNSHSVCLSRACQWACNDGYYADKGACKPVAQKCGGRWCKKVEDGYNVCVRNKCVPQCAGYLGYSLFTDGDGNYKCINLQNDPYNCGEVGNECGPGYNGLGYGVCYKGTCTVNCHGYGRPRQLPNGQYYCTLANSQ